MRWLSCLAAAANTALVLDMPRPFPCRHDLHVSLSLLSHPLLAFKEGSVVCQTPVLLLPRPS